MAEPATFPNDGAEYPWAEDFDGFWHHRHPTDPWVVNWDGHNSTGLCGLAFMSAHVSAHRPTYGKFCKECA